MTDIQTDNVTDMSFMENILEKIKHRIEEFKESKAQVVCQTCGLVFFIGPAKMIFEEDQAIYDFKMEAFNHAWDNPDHRVVVLIDYLPEEAFEIWGLKKFPPINFSDVVNAKKQYLRMVGSPLAYRKSSENWNPHVDRVECWVCQKVYNNVEKAVNCCFKAKSYLLLRRGRC